MKQNVKSFDVGQISGKFVYHFSIEILPLSLSLFLAFLFFASLVLFSSLSQCLSVYICLSLSSLPYHYLLFWGPLFGFWARFRCTAFYKVCIYGGCILASHPAALGSNPSSAKIYYLYCLVGEQYWDQTLLAIRHGFHKCSLRQRAELSSTKKFLLIYYKNRPTKGAGDKKRNIFCVLVLYLFNQVIAASLISFFLFNYLLFRLTQSKLQHLSIIKLELTDCWLWSFFLTCSWSNYAIHCMMSHCLVASAVSAITQPENRTNKAQIRTFFTRDN